MKLKENLGKIKNISKDQFELLYEISKKLNAPELEENLIEETLDLVIQVVDAERGLFVKYNEDSNSFEIVAGRNIRKESIDDLSKFSSGILQRVVESQKPCLYHDVQTDPSLSQFDSIQIHKIKSVLGVPVLCDGKVWGVILVDSQINRKEFTEENLFFLDFVSNLVSLSLNKIQNFQALRTENILLRSQVERNVELSDIIGDSPTMKKVFNLVIKVAATDATVLILGESGTGKELIARAIHRLSLRKDRPYIAQFCGSIPDTLLESELFGYKKGAFTGATSDKKGLFEVANGGTFFLDEIADISPALQAKLLRVLQSKEIIRLGDTKPIQVDVRIIAATNKDLKQLVNENKFREDLFYRLNVFPIEIPPLRERRSDISLLVKYFIKKYSTKEIKLLPQTLKKLENFYWPGNVRQLENVIQRALILCDGDTITPEHIVIEDEENLLEFKGTLEDFEKTILLKRLKEFNGNRTLTAKSLGVSVRWIQLKLKELKTDDSINE